MLKIFEIKIYPFSPTEFAKKKQVAKDKFIARYTDRTEIELRKMYSRFYGNKISFDDYSVGYLNILYWGSCLHYEARLMLSKRYSKCRELQSSIDILDDEEFQTEDMKEDEARKRMGYSYKLIPYIPPLFTEKKHYMFDHHIEGIYTGIRNKTNHEIAETIESEVMRIQKSDFFKGFYFDLSLFNTICNYIDFKKLFQKND